MSYVIFGMYQGTTEEIDSFDSLREANAMLREYRLSFGGGWQLWVKRCKGE